MIEDSKVERTVLDSLGDAWECMVDVCSTCRVALKALAECESPDAKWARAELERFGWGDAR